MPELGLENAYTGKRRARDDRGKRESAARPAPGTWGGRAPPCAPGPRSRRFGVGYARLCFELQHVGRPISERDLLIASIALARGLIVVTRSVSEFGRLTGLIVEDWA